MTTKTVTPPIDWDSWREAYDRLSFADQQAFYTRVFRDFPDQQRYSPAVLSGLLAHIDRPVTVSELGGWDGELASVMLEAHPEITSWENWEISTPARQESARLLDDLPQYSPRGHEGFYWTFKHRADVFVTSHVLEHLSLEHVLATFDAVDCQWMYLQAPLAEEATDWTGYRGSHTLECGWRGLESELAERGFRRIDDLSVFEARCYAR